MTTLRNDLLQAILREPDCDVVRLAYADVVEEEGDNLRSEFIRLQTELWRLGWTDAASGTGNNECNPPDLLPEQVSRSRWLCRRESELLWVAIERDWFGFPDLRLDWWARRGFVEKVSLSAEDWIANAAALLAAQPIREVVLTSRPPISRLYDEYAKMDWGVSSYRRIDHYGIRGALKDLWPGVKFTLPPTGGTRAGPALTADVRHVTM